MLKGKENWYMPKGLIDRQNWPIPLVNWNENWLKDGPPGKW